MAGTGREIQIRRVHPPSTSRGSRHLCRMGATEEEICRKFSVSVSAFNVYKNQHPELVEALKRGKVDADDAVEAALFRRATGYSYEEVRPNSYADNAENQAAVPHRRYPRSPARRHRRHLLAQEPPPRTLARPSRTRNRRRQHPDQTHRRGEKICERTPFSPSTPGTPNTAPTSATGNGHATPIPAGSTTSGRR